MIRPEVLMALLLSVLGAASVGLSAQESAAGQAAAASPAPTRTAGQATSAPAAAEDPAKASRLSAEQRAYIGRHVRVHRTDGTTTSGRLLGDSPAGVAVQPSPSDEPVLIPYDQVESIAAGMRRWKKIAIGAGAAAAVIAVAAAN
jgi:hypothetical protein